MSIGYEAQTLLDSLTDEEVSMGAACAKFDCSWAEVLELDRDDKLTLRTDTEEGRVYLSRKPT
jgi:hypothetical protein